MSESHESSRQQAEADARELHALGYAQELFRDVGGFSNFAIEALTRPEVVPSAADAVAVQASAKPLSGRGPASTNSKYSERRIRGSLVASGSGSSPR